MWCLEKSQRSLVAFQRTICNHHQRPQASEEYTVRSIGLVENSSGQGRKKGAALRSWFRYPKKHETTSWICLCLIKTHGFSDECIVVVSLFSKFVVLMSVFFLLNLFMWTLWSKRHWGGAGSIVMQVSDFEWLTFLLAWQWDIVL